MCRSDALVKGTGATLVLESQRLSLYIKPTRVTLHGLLRVSVCIRGARYSPRSVCVCVCGTRLCSSLGAGAGPAGLSTVRLVYERHVYVVWCLKAAAAGGLWLCSTSRNSAANFSCHTHQRPVSVPAEETNGRPCPLRTSYLKNKSVEMNKPGHSTLFLTGRTALETVGEFRVNF